MKLLRSSMNKTSETLRLKNMLFSPQSSSMKQANKELEGIMQNFANRFEANQIKLEVTQ